MAAEFLGEKPEHCLVVEDAEAGFEAAVRGGFHAAGIGDACKHSCVTYKLQTFDEILELQ